jgi:hypothetical protein
MDRKRVLEALETLNAELAGADYVNIAARQALERMSAQVREAINKDTAGDDAEDSSSEQLSGIQETLLEFGAEHPQLTGAINQVAAALANLGI